MDRYPKLEEATCREVWQWVVRRRLRVRVAGLSMSPLLQPGDEVLVDLFAYRRSPPAVGDIVVAWHPTRKDFKLIKRVVEITIDHHYVLQGDNLAESTDSRTFGAVPPTLIIGKVVCRF